MIPELESALPKISDIHVERLDLSMPLQDLAGHFTALPGTVLLLSGGNLDCARYHLLAVKPWLQFTGHGRQMSVVIHDRKFAFEADPFDTLAELTAAFNLNQADLPGPVAAGLFGYLAYDLKDHLEKLPRTSLDQLGLPQICLYAPRLLLIQDKLENCTHLCRPCFEGENDAAIQSELAAFHEQLRRPLPQDGHYAGNPAGFRSDFQEAEYIQAVRCIREYIAAGHVYQVNMSQRFEMEFNGDSFALFKTLYAENPAPFFAFIQAGDHEIVSTSPERFLRQQGRRIETRPIKGTRPRAATREADAAAGRDLLQSPKDDAELSMIVDLLRNDIGRVCRGGSVAVSEHKRLEAYQNVFHLVSVVTGELDQGKNSVDVIRATFPGGSITGCPKIRSMEIIDELEPVRRHIYTGSIGYIGFHETMDLSIAIRTATIYNGKIIFSTGGGIVFDSDPADEYQETLHKGRTLMEALACSPKADRSAAPDIVWINGRYRSRMEARLALDDLGVQYGYGFFETIRVHHGKPLGLSAHLQRFNRTWQQLFPSPLPDLTWDIILGEVVQRNGLADSISAVKIIATRGTSAQAPWDHTLAVTGRPYSPRPALVQKAGLDAAVYPEPRQTPLAAFKTLNYLYYYLAGEWARQNRADEALILNPDGSVSETNSANLILIKNQVAVLPLSPPALPGIMAERVAGFLSQKGFDIARTAVRPKDLFSVDLVLMTNALIGAVPILSVDGRPLPKPSDLWREINAGVLSPS